MEIGKLLFDNLEDKNKEATVCEIYNNDDHKSKQQESKKLEDKKTRADEVLRDKKKEGGKIARDLAKIEQDIREAESDMNKKHPLYIKAKEKVAHTQKKLDGVLKTLEQARKADEAHQSDIKKNSMMSLKLLWIKRRILNQKLH